MTKETLDEVERKFPNHSYIGCSLLRDGLPNKRIGQTLIMRTPPKLGSYLAFMDFNQIMSRPLDFAFSLLNTIDIDRRSKMIVRLCQTRNPEDPFYTALEESLLFTLAREI